MLEGLVERFAGTCFTCRHFRAIGAGGWCRSEDAERGYVHAEARCGWHEATDAVRHAAVCAECGQSWPCEHVRWEQEMEHLSRQLEVRCPVCGKEAPNGLVGTVVVGSAHYHVRKVRCLRVARSLLSAGDAAVLDRRVAAREWPGRFDVAADPV